MTHQEKLKEIQDHPENHQHGWEELFVCCLVDGALDTRLLEIHQKEGHDVQQGPCLCGAWH
jgi:hypothetical protein